MKTKVLEKTKAPIQIDWSKVQLVKHKDSGLIVLTTGYCSTGRFNGVVIVEGSEDIFKVGRYSTLWYKKSFEVVEDEVTIVFNPQETTTATKRYRFKTLEEFQATCKVNELGNFITGVTSFTKHMHHLLGKEINAGDASRIFEGGFFTLTSCIDGDLLWTYHKDMLTEIK